MCELREKMEVHKNIKNQLLAILVALRSDRETNEITSSTLKDILEKASCSLELMESAKLFSETEVRVERQQVRMAFQTILQRARDIESQVRGDIESFIVLQPEFIDDTYRFTVDYSDNYKDLWPRLLSQFIGRPNLKFLEVGSLEGRSACWFLSNVLTAPNSSLICIDRFDEKSLSMGLLSFAADSYGMSVYDRFMYNVSLTGKLAQVSVLRGPSQRCLRTVDPESIDLAYIDASHMAQDVLEDGILAWGALKCGGILVFDDYHWSFSIDDPLMSPKPAIDAFLYIFSKSCKLLHKGKQVFVLKNCHESD